MSQFSYISVKYYIGSHFVQLFRRPQHVRVDRTMPVRLRRPSIIQLVGNVSFKKSYSYYYYYYYTLAGIRQLYITHYFYYFVSPRVENSSSGPREVNDKL
jgi:hypothetical protein